MELFQLTIFCNTTQISTNQPIIGVRREDGSGSTFLISNHLNTTYNSPFNWNRGVGTNSTTGPVPSNPAPNTVYWPSNFLSGQGGSGVARTIASNAGGFGYVENSTRIGERLPFSVLQNRAGNFISATPAAVSIAFTTVNDLDPDPRIITITVPDPVQPTAFPILGVTYQLYYDDYSSGSVAVGIRGFINDFVADPTPSSDPLLNADTIAINRGYAPLSTALKTRVRNVVNTYVDTTRN